MRRAVLRPLAVGAAEIAAFVAATIFMTWPLVLHLPSRLSNLGDPMLNSWVVAWVVRAVGTNPLRLFQGNIFHPEPDTLAYTDHMLSVLPVSAPTWLATHNGVFVHNVVLLALVAFGGWSAYRLALYVTGRRAAAAAAGVIFGFSPYVVSHLSQIQLLATYAIPATWLWGLRLLRTARRRDALGLATFSVLGILSSWYMAVFLFLSLAALLGAEAVVRRREIAWRRVAVLLAAVGVVVAAVAFVVSRPYVAIQERYPQAARSVGEAELYSVTPRSVLVAPPENVLYGDITARFRPSDYIERTLFVGLVPGVLAISSVAGAIRRRRAREVAPWLVAGGSMLVLAFGPFMRFGSLRLPLPFLVLHAMAPPLRFIRAPGRAFGVMMLAVAVLAAMALARGRRPRLRTTLSVAAVVLVGVEFASVPMTLTPAPQPSSAYGYLAASRVPGAVLELPTVPVVDGRPEPGAEVKETVYVYLSTAHWRPILNGYSGLFPPTHAEMVREVQSFPGPSSLRFLRSRGVSFVAVHLDELEGGPWESLARGIRDPALDLVADDGRVRLYRLR